MRWKVYTLFLGVLVILFLSACSKSPEEKILGYWEATGDNSFAVAFYKDTVLFRPIKGEEAPAFNYKFLNDHTIKINQNGSGALFNVRFINDNLLDMQIVGAQEEFKLKRINESEFNKAALRAAKKLFIKKVEASLLNCLTKLEASEQQSINCEIGDTPYSIYLKNYSYYFLNDDELDTERSFSNGVVKITCVFKGTEPVCR